MEIFEGEIMSDRPLSVEGFLKVWRFGWKGPWDESKVMEEMKADLEKMMKAERFRCSGIVKRFAEYWKKAPKKGFFVEQLLMLSVDIEQDPDITVLAKDKK